MLREMKFVFLLLLLTFGCASMATRNSHQCFEKVLDIVHEKAQEHTRIAKKALIANQPLKEQVNKEPRVVTICISMDDSTNLDGNDVEQDQQCYNLIQ